MSESIGGKKTIKGLLAKAEFARMYNMSTREASRFFAENLESLLKTGYRKNSHFISPKTMQAIIEILGPPEVDYNS